MKKFSLLILFITLMCFFANFAQANIYYWNPAGSSRSFSTPGNWRKTTCGGTVADSIPRSGDSIFFSNCSSKECHINANAVVSYISLGSTYGDTLYQDNGKTFSFGEGLFKGGVFMGGNSAITCSNNIIIDGTAFKSTSDVFTVTGDFTYKTGVFTHNNGKVAFNKGGNVTTTVNSTSNSITISFYKVEFGAPVHNTSFNVKNIDMQVTNELKLSGDSSIILLSTTGSIIQAKGDVLSSNTSTLGGGTVTIEINGTGSQTWSDNSGTDATGKFPNIKINKSSGTLALSGNIAIGGSSDLNYVAGTLAAGTSTVMLYYNNLLRNNSSGAMDLYNLEIMGNGGKDSVKGTITVANNLVTSSTGNCIIHTTNGGNGILEVKGNVQWDNSATSFFGNITFKFSGANAQIFNGAIEPVFYNMEINKSGNEVTLSHALTISHNLNLVSKNVVTTTTNLLTLTNGATVSNGSSSSFVSGPLQKIGNSAFTFPIGKNSYYKPINITSPSLSTDLFIAQYFNAQQTHGSNKDSLTYVSACEYWNLMGTGNVKVTLYWDNNTCNIYTLSTLRVAKWDGSKWNNTGMVTTTGNTTSGSMQTNSSLSPLGDFTIGKRSPVVTAYAGSNSNVCLGSSLTIGGAPSATGGLSPYSYSWSPASSLSSSTTTNPTATPTANTAYTLTVTDLDHSTSTSTVGITVSSNPITDAGNDTTLCQYLPLSLGGSPTATGGRVPYSYQWKNLVGTTLYSTANPSFNTDTSIAIVLTVTDDAGCKGYDTIQVGVNLVPIANAGRDTIVCKDFEFHVGAVPTATGGSSPYNYLWKNPHGDTLFKFSNPFIEADTSVLLYLSITDVNGCQGKDTLQIAVRNPIVLNLHLDTTLYLNRSCVLNPTASGGVGPLSYDWSPIKWLNDSTVLHPTCTPFSSIQYTLIVTDSIGCYQEAFASVKFSSINLGSLQGYAVFALDSILVGDSSIAIGNVAAKYADTLNLHISNGTLHSDTSELSALSRQFNSITSFASTVASTEISSNLTNSKLSSGIYRIDSLTEISDSLIISGNDSSFFILNINGDLIIDDSASIVLNGIDKNDVYFIVNGELHIGSDCEIYGNYFSTNDINIRSFNGIASMFSMEGIDIALSATKLAYVNSICTLSVGINYPSSNGFDGSGYSLVFDDEFTDNVLDPIHWQEVGIGRNGVNGVTYVNPDFKLDGSLSNTPSNVVILNQELNLLVKYFEIPDLFHASDGSPFSFTGSQIQTKDYFYHGRFEIKARQPFGTGLWPACWLYNEACKTYEEFDLFDNTDDKNRYLLGEKYPNVNASDPCEDTSRYTDNEMLCFFDNSEGSTSAILDLSLGSNPWNIYGAEWDDENIYFYVNNTLVKTLPNHLNSERMQLILGCVAWEHDNNWPNSTMPFQIEYVKVWQKEDEVFDYYFRDRNGFLVTPANFCVGECYHLETSAYAQNDPNITWTAPNGGIRFKQWSTWDFGGDPPTFCTAPDADDPNNFATSAWCDFIPTSEGDHTITLTATQPIPETHNINIHISSPPVPTFDQAPTPFNYGAVTNWTIYNIPSADDYEWNFTLPNGDPSTGLTLGYNGIHCHIETVDPGSYRINVRAHNCSGWSDWMHAVLYVNNEPCGGGPGCLRTSDTTLTENFINIYPSPSDGSIWVENTSNKSINITLRSILNDITGNIIITPRNRTQLHHLPEGILIIEGSRNGEVILRRKIVVFRSH